jgi:hypothetical protein
LMLVFWQKATLTFHAYDLQEGSGVNGWPDSLQRWSLRQLCFSCRHWDCLPSSALSAGLQRLASSVHTRTGINTCGLFLQVYKQMPFSCYFNKWSRTKLSTQCGSWQQRCLGSLRAPTPLWKLHGVLTSPWFHKGTGQLRNDNCPCGHANIRSIQMSSLFNLGEQCHVACASHAATNLLPPLPLEPSLLLWACLPSCVLTMTSRII